MSAISLFRLLALGLLSILFGMMAVMVFRVSLYRKIAFIGYMGVILVSAIEIIRRTFEPEMVRWAYSPPLLLSALVSTVGIYGMMRWGDWGRKAKRGEWKQ